MPLTTTSYLILGMLSARDWSAYELAEQVDKGLTEVWPRARRQLYNAPKALLAEGLVTATRSAAGRRSRTVYSITPAGREALRQWLTTPARPPALEFEGMLHVLLADAGGVEDLRRTLRDVIEHAARERERFEGHAALIRATGGTYPARQHLFRLSWEFMLGHYAHMSAWATWALEQIESWPDTTSPSEEPGPTHGRR
jgi:DNA-binding PadR family transcriptional regulator